MVPEERQTHRNLQAWMIHRAEKFGVQSQGEDDDDDDEEEEELTEEMKKKLAVQEKLAQDRKEDEEKPKIVEEKNYSSVSLAYEDTKLSFRGHLSALNFTNWLWHHVVRDKLEETKGKVPDDDMDGVAECDAILREFCPAKKEKKDKDDKKDKKDKEDKDDKKDKKDKKDDKKDKKEDKKKVDKKMEVKLSSAEKIQVQNLIRNMIFGESGKNKTVVQGWANMVMEKDIPSMLPWEFQLAHILRSCLEMEYRARKKKELPNPIAFYEAVQSLADAVATIRRQYKHFFPGVPDEQFMPLQDALAVQKRLMEGSLGDLKFDLLWYLRNGAHLLAGSFFAKRHISTVFKPFSIQEQMADAIFRPGPQLLFGIAPPGTGKTATVSHLLNLFPAHTQVFCCAALPVVLGVGRIANTLGLPYAFVKGRRITPSFACGRGLGTFVDNWVGDEKTGAVRMLQEKVIELNMNRKRKRLALKKKQRNLHNVKKMPRLYLLCDISSCAWLLQQLNANRSILVIDEPPMGADKIPENPQDNPLAAAMAQAMMTPMYKTIWMSATLPKKDELPTLVSNFCERFGIAEKDRANHINECFSSQLDRGAVLCRPNGSVAFPHELCKTADDIRALTKRLPTDPLVLKAYTERALSAMLGKWTDLKEKKKIPANFKVAAPEDQFADLSNINHTSIRQYCMDILLAVADTGDDEFIKTFCSMEGAVDTLFPAYNLKEMVFSNAAYFPGLTLMADDKPADLLEEVTAGLQAQMPKVEDLMANLALQEEAAKKQEKYMDDDEKAQVETVQPKLKFSPELVIQSEQFLKKWCPSSEGKSGIQRLLPSVHEFRTISKLPISDKHKMLALAGAGSFDPTLDEDANNPFYTQWVHDAMTANKLACVTAGKEFTWGANVPASTVVVTKSFAENTSVAGILQYVGRAARRGLTTHGQAIFEREEDLDRIFAPTDGMSTEARTMERYAEWWLSNGSTW